MSVKAWLGRVSLGIAVLASTAVSAQTVEEFYKGKTIKLIVGSGASGGNDIFARTFAKYYSKHIPGNPVIVVQNLPANGGVAAAATLYNKEARDGTVIAAVTRTIPILPITQDHDLQYDPLKMNWLGSLNKEANVIIAWHTSPIKSLQDAMKKEMVVGTSGTGQDSYVYAKLLNQTLGTKFKIISGYPGGPDIDLAMERGEVEGRVSITWSSLRGGRAEWLREKKVNILAQMALHDSPDLPGVPNVLDMVKNPLDKQVYEFLFARQEAGRPFVAPPEVPADRLAALRKAFDATAEDPEFVTEITAKGGSVELLNGDEMQALIVKMYKTPKDVLKAVRQVLDQQ